jgi:hypothetical protein
MVETRAYFYRLSHSNFGLEIHMIGYKNVAHIHCEPISAIGLTVFLRSTNGARTFGSFTFIQQDQKESLRQIITDNLRVPVDKLKNGLLIFLYFCLKKHENIYSGKSCEQVFWHNFNSQQNTRILSAQRCGQVGASEHFFLLHTA